MVYPLLNLTNSVISLSKDNIFGFPIQCNVLHLSKMGKGHVAKMLIPYYNLQKIFILNAF